MTFVLAPSIDLGCGRAFASNIDIAESKVTKINTNDASND